MGHSTIPMTTTVSEDKPDTLKVVNLDDPRHCPHCGSNKWKWLETIPASPKTIGQSLLMMYRCEKCWKEFLAAEKAQATLIDKPVERCVHCGSPRIKQMSMPDADINLYFCKQCRCWMGVEPKGISYGYSKKSSNVLER